MLIEKKGLGPQDVAVAKLITGEEIVFRVVQVDANTITMTKPLTLVMAQMPSGQPMVAMAPFSLGIDENAKIDLDLSKTLVCHKARADLAHQYRQNTSDIAIPDLGSLSGLGGTTGPGSPLPPLRGSVK